MIGPCEAALVEACNHQDDDCDGAIDEDFRDDERRYVSPQHCGDSRSPVRRARTAHDGDVLGRRDASRWRAVRHRL